MSTLDIDLLNQLRAMPLFQNPLLSWGIALLTSAVLLTVLLVARGFVRRQHQRMRATEQTELLEVPFEILSRTTLLFFVILSLVTGLSTLSMAEGTRKLVSSAFFVVNSSSVTFRSSFAPGESRPSEPSRVW